MSARVASLRPEGGFTIVEVLVAILIFATGAIAVFGILDAANRNTFRAEQTQVAINQAQKELEAIHQLPYGSVGMTATPEHSTDPTNPFFRVNGNQFALGWNSSTHATSNNATMVVNNVGGDTGTLNPGPQPFVSGDVSGKIYRFVVWQRDPTCDPNNLNLRLCSTNGHDYKRVIVIVTLDTVPVSYARSYTELQSSVTDPSASSLSGATSAGGGTVTAQQLWLTDTTCDQSNPMDWSQRDQIGDHLTHNTLGNCTGTNPPDGLYPQAPDDPDPFDPTIPKLYDYATDPIVEPTPDSSDNGLQMVLQDTNTCDYSGGTVGNQQFKVHRWASQYLPNGFVLSGQATLKLFTRTIKDVTAGGGICVWLFTRNSGIDTPVQNAAQPLAGAPTNFPQANYYTYSQAVWPRGAWTEIDINMTFPPLTFPPTGNQRLGVAIAIDKSKTQPDVLEFMYDHPDYASRLEVNTTTPLQ